MLAMKTDGVSNEIKAEILDAFLDKYRKPAFGSLSKAEIDMLVLELLEQTGIIRENTSQYVLSKELKISQAKAKNLLYNRTLRKCSEEKLDDMAKELLQRPVSQKDDGEWFLFHVGNPLLIEHIKNKIHSLGYISDGSFSPTIIKLSVGAFAALIESYIPNKDEVLKDLNIPDGSLKGFLIDILKSSAKTLANQFVGETGNLLADKFFNYLPKLWQKWDKKLFKQFRLEKTTNNGGSL